MEPDIIFQHIVNGVVSASIYMFIAVGVTLTFSLTGIVFFAQGEFLAIGGLAVWKLNEMGERAFLSISAAVAIAATAGLFAERIVFRFARGSAVHGFVISLGLILVLQNAMVKIFSGEPRSLPPPVQGVWHFGGADIAVQRIVVVGVALAVALSLIVFLRRTRWGRWMRAAAEDAETAKMLGIPVELVTTAAFVGGCALAGLGGVLWISLFPVTPYTGASLIVKAFAVVVVGGLGNVEGAVVAALLLGLAESFGTVWIETQWTSALAFLLIIATLLLRPNGLFRGLSGVSV